MAQFPISPSDIDVTKHFYDAFGSSEREFSANWIVRFCQKRGNWNPFTYDQINDFYKSERTQGDDFEFDGLEDEGYYIKLDGDLYSITPHFVGRCWASSPMK